LTKDFWPPSTANAIRSAHGVLDERFADISGVIWSRVGLGNLSRRSRPLTYVHNPLAQVPLATSWGVWDREFVITPRGDEWEANDILAQAAEHHDDAPECPRLAPSVP
jgi:hypothetical protein